MRSSSSPGTDTALIRVLRAERLDGPDADTAGNLMLEAIPARLAAQPFDIEAMSDDV